MKKLVTALGSVALGLLAVQCGHPAVKSDPRPVVLHEEPELSFSLRTFQARDLESRLVGENDKLHNGDFIYFTVLVSQQAYLYVVLFGSDKSVRTLFPTPQHQLAPAGCTLRVPAGKTLILDGPEGEDKLLVVVSRRPLAEVDRRLCEELRLSCDTAASTRAPAVAPCEATTTAPAPAPVHVAERGVIRAVQTGRAENNGVAETRFSLRHAPR